jgi:hypothetical protein
MATPIVSPDQIPIWTQVFLVIPTPETGIESGPDKLIRRCRRSNTAPTVFGLMPEAPGRVRAVSVSRLGANDLFTPVAYYLFLGEFFQID